MVAEAYPNLISLNLSDCGNITNASMFRLGELCHKLEELDLGKYQCIDDWSIVRLCESCPYIQKIGMSGRSTSTDVKLIQIADSCLGLQMLGLEGSNPNHLTDSSTLKILTRSKLINLNLYTCAQLTDVTIMFFLV